MIILLKNNYGTVKIRKEVIKKMIEKEASEVYGLAGINKRTSKNVLSLLSGDTDKGIQVELTDEGLVIDMSISIHSGLNVKAVVENIMENVSYKLESILGINVDSVNVAIEKVSIEG